MALADLEVLAGLGLPLAGETLVDVAVELAGRVVGDVEQLAALCCFGCLAAAREEQGCGEDGGDRRLERISWLIPLFINLIDLVEN